MNKEIRELEYTLIDVLNQSPVDTETKRILCENLMYKLSHEADKLIVEEIRQEEENAESTY